MRSFAPSISTTDCKLQIANTKSQIGPNPQPEAKPHSSEVGRLRGQGSSICNLQFAICNLQWFPLALDAGIASLSLGVSPGHGEENLPTGDHRLLLVRF